MVQIHLGEPIGSLSSKLGAGAVSHNTYFHNMATSNTPTYIGYHYFVDDNIAYLEMTNYEVAWTNGDGDGNMQTVSVEICVNPESNFAVARDNGAYIAAVELHDNGIKTVIDGVADKASGNLFQHWCWSSYKKNCPQTIRNQGLWGEFFKATQTHLDALWGVEVEQFVYDVILRNMSTSSEADTISDMIKAKGYPVTEIIKRKI